MRWALCAVMAAALLSLAAPCANADDVRVRDLQAAVDSYLASANDEAHLVGGPGSAGYDGGFWIRGGDFMLRINATLQARFESFNWDNEDVAANAIGQPFAGDLSGFSLPRATIKLSGEAPCDINYYIELEFGHFGRDAVEQQAGQMMGPGQLGPQDQTDNFDNTREAWIEWASSPSLNIRMGQIKAMTTRQHMTPPELQQFVDVSLATSVTGFLVQGDTDRNRDHGVAVHGSFGCDNEWWYCLYVVNGDGGDSVRNVLDHRTSDNLAYGARLNWAFLEPIGYEEGALRQQTCKWYGEVGLWGFYYADRTDKPHTTVKDAIRYGIDLALGYGGFSFTGAFTMATDEDVGGGGADIDYTAYLAQLGYHFPGTAWEIAARYSGYNIDAPTSDAGVYEYAFGVNYYLNGHGNKLQVDISFIEGDDANSVLIYDPYPGYAGGLVGEESAILLRFQWQLAL
ncbi:MAG: porin [Planctomycetota bacterium]|nr:porin [Planctomycetota bacterium]